MKYDLVKPEDIDGLQAFSCGNEKLDYFIKKEKFDSGGVNADDDLPFKVWNTKTGDIILLDFAVPSGYYTRKKVTYEYNVWRWTDESVLLSRG